MLREAIIALGGNLGNTAEVFELALIEVADAVGPVIARSAWVETAAMIHPTRPRETQRNYLNGVVVALTNLSAESLLEALHSIERICGRYREKERKRWQARVIDLDLIALDDEVISSEGLTIPHPEMQNRDFVLAPLAEVRPHWTHPVTGKSVNLMLAELACTGHGTYLVEESS